MKYDNDIAQTGLTSAEVDSMKAKGYVNFGNFVETGNADIQTASTILLGVIGLMIVYQIAKPMDLYKWGVFGICTVGLIVAMLFFRNLFEITELSLAGLLLCINFSIMCEPFYRYLRRIVLWTESLFHVSSQEMKS